MSEHEGEALSEPFKPLKMLEPFEPLRKEGVTLSPEIGNTKLLSKINYEFLKAYLVLCPVNQTFNV